MKGFTMQVSFGKHSAHTEPLSSNSFYNALVEAATSLERAVAGYTSPVTEVRIIGPNFEYIDPTDDGRAAVIASMAAEFDAILAAVVAGNYVQDLLKLLPDFEQSGERNDVINNRALLAVHMAQFIHTCRNESIAVHLNEEYEARLLRANARPSKA